MGSLVPYLTCPMSTSSKASAPTRTVVQRPAKGLPPSTFLYLLYNSPALKVLQTAKWMTMSQSKVDNLLAFSKSADKAMHTQMRSGHDLSTE